MEDFIKIENVSFKYDKNDKTNVLNDISLNIKKGEFVCILGANGSGKSTLSKHLNALLLPSYGKVFVNGIDTSNEDRAYEIHQMVGLVLQNPDNQIVASIVKEDVAFGPENLALPSEEIKLRVESSLKAVGLYDKMESSTYELSGGQKQKLALAGVLAMNPECIVLDEPTAMLDPTARKEVIETLKFLNKKFSITIVLITHYIEEAIQADRVVVMSNGSVVLSGAPKNVFSQVELLKKYSLDIPQTTELLYKLNEHGCNLPLDALGVQECADEIAEMLGGFYANNRN